MVVIRLRTIGRAHHTVFRVVAADRRSPRDGKVLETLGTYDQRATRESDKMKIKRDRVLHWLRAGAQPSDRIWNMLRKQGITKKNYRELTAEAPAAVAGAAVPAGA